MHQDHGIIASLVLSAIAGFLVAVIGSFFDDTPNNHNAKMAGLAVFVLLFLALLFGVL